MFHLSVNGYNVDWSQRTLAMKVAPTLCEKVGDVVTLTEGEPSEGEEEGEEGEEGVGEEDTNTFIEVESFKMKDGSYSSAMSEFKYHKSGKRWCDLNKSMAYNKRQFNRACRLLNKAIILEGMNDNMNY